MTERKSSRNGARRANGVVLYCMGTSVCEIKRTLARMENISASNTQNTPAHEHANARTKTHSDATAAGALEGRSIVQSDVGVELKGVRWR